MKQLNGPVVIGVVVVVVVLCPDGAGNEELGLF
jgi:hypothetical protein